MWPFLLLLAGLLARPQLTQALPTGKPPTKALATGTGTGTGTGPPVAVGVAAAPHKHPLFATSHMFALGSSEGVAGQGTFLGYGHQLEDDGFLQLRPGCFCDEAKDWDACTQSGLFDGACVWANEEQCKGPPGAEYCHWHYVKPLKNALKNSKVKHIKLEAGFYTLDDELIIAREVRIEGAPLWNGEFTELRAMNRHLKINAEMSAGLVELKNLRFKPALEKPEGWSPALGHLGRGGILINTGNVSVNNCTIYDNYQELGGGVYVYNGQVTFTSSNIYGNTANWDGGGAYIKNGQVTFTSSNIYDNTASKGYGYGGGVYIGDGIANFNDCQIYNNQAYYGGGVIIAGGTVNLNNCQIDNQASQGSNIYIASGKVCASPEITKGVEPSGLDTCKA